MKIQLKGFYVQKAPIPDNSKKSFFNTFTVMDRFGTARAILIPETNKDGQLCNYLIINLSSVPNGYLGTKMGLIHSLKLNQEELDSFEQWWTHGIVNQLSKPDQEITFNVGEGGPMVVIDGFKYTFGLDFRIMMTADPVDGGIEIYSNIFDMPADAVSELFERIKTYLNEYEVNYFTEPTPNSVYSVFEVQELKTAPQLESSDVSVKKFRCIVTNLNASTIPNLATMIHAHIPLQESAKYIEIDPQKFKIIYGELKDQCAVLDAYQPYEPENSLEEAYGFGRGIATFKPQGLTFIANPEIKTYTLDFDFYLTYDDVSPDVFHAKVRDLKQNPNTDVPIYHIIL